MGGDVGGGSGRPAVSGGCRTKFQLEKKSPIVQLPRVCVFLAGSSEADPEVAAPSPARPGCPRRYPPRPGEGQGPAGPARWRGAGGGWGGARDDYPTPGFLHSASPPPLGAHRRPLLRPGVALLRRRRSWRLGPGGGLCSARAAGAPAGVSRGQPAGGTGCSRRSRRALRSEQTSGGAGGARGRLGVRNPPLPGRFQAPEGRLEGGGARALQAGDPTGGDRSAPTLRPL